MQSKSSGNPGTPRAIPCVMPLDPQKVLKPLRKVHKALAHPARLLTPEGVHDLRTQCYRIRSMIFAFALHEGYDGAQLLRAIEPVRKRAGKVRDADVLTSLAASLPDGSASESLVEIMEDLGVRHARSAGKLEKTLHRQRRKVRRQLKTCTKQIKREITAPQSDVADRWRRNAVAHSLALASELAQWPALRDENLHPFRLKVKELRYVLRFASDAEREFVDALGEVKDAIGEWHDWNELAAVAAKVLGDKGRSPVSRQIASVVQTKLKNAHTLASRLRRNFLDTEAAGHGSQKAPRKD